MAHPLYTTAYLLQHDSLYCDDASSRNKLFDLHPSSNYLTAYFVFVQKISLEQSSAQIECWNICFQCLCEAISSTPPQVLPHWQEVSTLQYALHLNSGRVTFFTLLTPNFMQSLRKTNEWSPRYLKTDGLTNGQGRLLQ